MSRKETPMPENKEVPANLEVIDAEVHAANQLAVLHREGDARVRAVAQQLGYQLPADCTDPDLIQRDIAANMRRSVEACLEVGRGLVALKEACAHEEFINRLDVLGINYGVAQKFIQTAVKFSTSRTALNAAGGQSKLFEMLVLDDEQIEELELTGQTGELALDDVARMSVKELRAAVRKERKEKERHQSVAQETATELAELKTTFKREAPAEELLRLKTEAARLGSEIEALILGALRQAVIGIGNLGEERGAHGAFLAGVVGGVQRQLTELRAQFDLPDASATPTPSDVEAAESVAALRAGMAAIRAQAAQAAAAA